MHFSQCLGRAHTGAAIVALIYMRPRQQALTDFLNSPNAAIIVARLDSDRGQSATFQRQSSRVGALVVYRPSTIALIVRSTRPGGPQMAVATNRHPVVWENGKFSREIGFR